MFDATTAARLELPDLFDWFHPPALDSPEIPDRFWQYVRTDGPIIEAMPHLGPCWPWTGGKNTHGYGWFGQSMTAPRWLFEQVFGPIPEGCEKPLVPDHLCHTFHPTCRSGATCLHRACVSPLHLELVTQRVNVLRGNGVKPWRRAWD